MPFIVFEGAEGVGKTTQIAAVAKELRSSGLEPVVTREPGGTPFAERVRSLFKAADVDGDEPTAWTELFLVAAARAQHLERVVRPALQRGAWVICDRFLDSAFVYQGIRAGLGCTAVQKVHELFMAPSDVPDHTFILDLAPQIALERLNHRIHAKRGAAQMTLIHEGCADMTPKRQDQDPQEGPDRLDGGGLEALTVMREGFLQLMQTLQTYPQGICPSRTLVDASANHEEITQTIWRHLQQLMHRPERR